MWERREPPARRLGGGPIGGLTSRQAPHRITRGMCISHSGQLGLRWRLELATRHTPISQVESGTRRVGSLGPSPVKCLRRQGATALGRKGHTLGCGAWRQFRPGPGRRAALLVCAPRCRGPLPQQLPCKVVTTKAPPPTGAPAALGRTWAWLAGGRVGAGAGMGDGERGKMVGGRACGWGSGHLPGHKGARDTGMTRGKIACMCGVDPRTLYGFGPRAFVRATCLACLPNA